MINANLSLRDRKQFKGFKWQFSCFKNLRDTVIYRALCDKCYNQDVIELLRLRECKWLVPSVNPEQNRVRSPSGTKAPPGNAVEWPCCYTSLSMHTLLAPTSLCLHLLFPSEMAILLLFHLPKAYSCDHSNGFLPPL